MNQSVCNYRGNPDAKDAEPDSPATPTNADSGKKPVLSLAYSGDQPKPKPGVKYKTVLPIFASLANQYAESARAKFQAVTVSGFAGFLDYEAARERQTAGDDAQSSATLQAIGAMLTIKPDDSDEANEAHILSFGPFWRVYPSKREAEQAKEDLLASIRSRQDRFPASALVELYDRMDDSAHDGLAAPIPVPATEGGDTMRDVWQAVHDAADRAGIPRHTQDGTAAPKPLLPQDRLAILVCQQKEMQAKDALIERLIAAGKSAVLHWEQCGQGPELSVAMDQLEKAMLLRPLECIKCNAATGPLHPMESDHAGWVCERCDNAAAEIDRLHRADPIPTSTKETP